MGVVLDIERLTSVSTTVPVTYTGGGFATSLGKADTLAGAMKVVIRPAGGDIRVGMAGKTASSTVGWLIKDGEVWSYDDDIRLVNLIAMAASTNIELLYEKV